LPAVLSQGETNVRERTFEIERLRRELDKVREDRNNLHKWLCDIIPIDRTEITPEEFEEIKKNARDLEDVLRDLLPPEQHHLIGMNRKQS
jgi:hypothetical protein